VDVFVQWQGRSGEELAKTLSPVGGDGVELSTISNRGTKVWPDGSPETFCTDQWCCRFRSIGSAHVILHKQIVRLLDRIDEAGLDFIKIENLYNFDGEPGYSLGQGGSQRDWASLLSAQIFAYTDVYIREWKARAQYRKQTAAPLGSLMEPLVACSFFEVPRRTAG